MAFPKSVSELVRDGVHMWAATLEAVEKLHLRTVRAHA